MNQYTSPRGRALGTILQIAIVVVAAGVADCHAQAQRFPIPLVDAVSMFVRVWPGEGAWDNFADHYGIAEVFKNLIDRPSTPETVHGLAFESQLLWIASRYSKSRFRPEETPWRPPRQLLGRPWVRELGADCLEPAHWPRNLRWDKHVDYCRAMVARAERIIEGGPDWKPPCTGGPVHHWGSLVIPVDVERVERQADPNSPSYRKPSERWRLATWSCTEDGETKISDNGFYEDPRRSKGDA